MLLDGQYIADTTRAKYVWEHPYYPQYYIPKDDTNVKSDGPAESGYQLLTPPSSTQHKDTALLILQGPLAGLIRFDFKAMDGWLEEDEPIYVHPKDPYKRVDVCRSSRAIKVAIDGEVVAESTWAMHLFETGLPTRYYLPQTAAKRNMLTPSQTITSCPYKGDANYYNVVVNGMTHNDAIWWYKHPAVDVLPITGMFCFYNEKVDIWLDGKKLERPKTHFG